MTYIDELTNLGREDVDRAGGKGANLGELMRAGFPVPSGFVVMTQAYVRFVEANRLTDAILELATQPAQDQAEVEQHAGAIRRLFTDGTIPDGLRQELLDAYDHLGDGVAVAVRSSATAEDLAEASFAGQQDTYLNIRGHDALIAAVRDCWASLWTARAMSYRARQHVEPATVRLAVVVQRMVHADAAGVMFTANPANGRRDEAVISAAWGLGEAVVSGAVTTDNLIVGKQTGEIHNRSTARKAVMTVEVEHGTVEQPVPIVQQSRPVLSDEEASALVRLGAQIEEHFGAPQDIEWAYAGGAFSIVQARPLTALPEPEAAPPIDWPVPEKSAFYFRASIVEQLPDPLSPLFADLADTAVTRSLDHLFQEVLGRGVLQAGDLGFPTINGYAYYRYSMAGMVRMMLRLPTAMRLLTATGPRSGQAQWRDDAHPRYVGIVKEWTARPIHVLDSEELLGGAVALLAAGCDYYTAVQFIITLASSSEILFTQFYDRLVRRAADPPAQIFLLGFDSAPIKAEKSLWDLAVWTREYPSLVTALMAQSSAGVVDVFRTNASPSADVVPEVWDQWRERFHAHLDTFGHSVYNLDFLNPVPAEEPAPLVDTIRFYLRGQGTNPHERQARAAALREREMATIQERLGPRRQAAFRRLLGWAQSLAPIREDALADVGLAWPRMLGMLLELGNRLASAGIVAHAEDVFWLRSKELESSLAVAHDGIATANSRPETTELRVAIEQRKMMWRGQRRVTPPQLLPKGSWIEAMQGFMPAGAEDQTGDIIRGTGASRGRVTATARVIAGPQDFSRLQPGDVLVTSITTPAWTSLFAMAGGVVTDVGGPLSHSSIVAREYGIPAVLGTGVATRRIRDGQTVLVDGDAGSVKLIGDNAMPANDRAVSPQTATSSRLPGARTLALAAIAAVVLFWLIKRRKP